MHLYINTQKNGVCARVCVYILSEVQADVTQVSLHIPGSQDKHKWLTCGKDAAVAPVQLLSPS